MQFELSEEGLGALSAHIAEFRTNFRDLGMAMTKKGVFTHADRFCFGCLDRSMQLTESFSETIDDRKFLLAGALVRLQLDTFLRLNAHRHVPDRQEFFRAVASEGAYIKRMRGVDGSLLTDRRLVELAEADVPWVRNVYEKTSGFIHLSGPHFSAFLNLEEGDRFKVQIGGAQTQVPLESWFEAALVFDKINVLLATQINEIALDLHFSFSREPFLVGEKRYG